MNLPTERHGILRCQGYRRMETLRCEYTYFHRHKELCSICDAHNGTFYICSAVHIHGLDRVLQSRFVFSDTIHAGTLRRVSYADLGTAAFFIRLQSLTPARFVILLPWGAIDVLPSDDGYAFFIDAREIARLRIAFPDAGTPYGTLRKPSGYDQGFLIEAELHCPLNEEAALAILSFPALKFYDGRLIDADPSPTDVEPCAPNALWKMLEWEGNSGTTARVVPEDDPYFVPEAEEAHPVYGGDASCFGHRSSSMEQTLYEFLDGEQKLCEVRCAKTPDCLVSVQGFGMEWSSIFNWDTTVYPGVSRSVTDAATGREAFHIVLKELGKCSSYMITLPGYPIRATYSAEDGCYSFYLSDRLVADILWAPWPNGIPSDETPQQCLCVRFQEPLDARCKLAILSFPMLQFGC